MQSILGGTGRMYEKTCECGVIFTTPNYNRKRCKSSCRKRNPDTRNNVRAHARAEHEVEFIAVDGEGVNVKREVITYNDDGEEEITFVDAHEYVLISVGDQSLHNNGEPLDHEDIFAFLWEQYLEHPNAAFVGFFLGYDFTQWFRSLHYKSAYSLLTKDGIAARQPTKNSEMRFPFPVRDGGRYFTDDGDEYTRPRKWEFDVLGMKRFKLRPYVRPEEVPTRIVNHKDGTQSVVKVTRPWMYVCDVGPFFQCSFLKAIDPRTWDEPIVTAEEFDIISAGKAEREDARLNDDMIRYNLLENEVLARLMRKLNEGFVSDGIRLTKQQWMGPGQAAQEWMKKIGVPTGETVRDTVPRWALEAGRMTYYGGWFEIFNHGPVPGTSYAYDINSAYPAVIATLPCLLHGRWTRGVGKPGRLPSGAYRMVYGTFKGRDSYVGPLPYREPDNTILRPHKVLGWYWWHEAKAAQRAGLLTTMDILEWVQYEPCKCDPPMSSIVDLYQGRLTVGKNSPSGKAKKLVYNSAYGKCAQSIGQPRFSNSIYASLITSGCRTQILDAIATHPTKSASLLMVATDGIVFKEPHPSLNIDGKALGAWDAEEYENLSLFMPGLYWHDKARDDIREGKSPSLKSRGVSAKYLGRIIDRVDKRWIEYGPDVPPPRIGLTIDFAVVGAKQAIVRNRWETCGQVIRGAIRWLDGKPDAKRAGMNGYNAFGGLRSWPYGEGSNLETTYYQPRFGDEIDDIDEEGSYVTPDGSIGDIQAWAFGMRG